MAAIKDPYTKQFLVWAREMGVRQMTLGGIDNPGVQHVEFYEVTPEEQTARALEQASAADLDELGELDGEAREAVKKAHRERMQYYSS